MPKPLSRPAPTDVAAVLFQALSGLMLMFDMAASVDQSMAAPPGMRRDGSATGPEERLRDRRIHQTLAVCSGMPQ